MQGRGKPRRLSISHNNSGLLTAQGGVSHSAKADNEAFFQNERMRLFLCFFLFLQ